MRSFRTAGLLIFLLSVLSVSVHANIALPSMFSDNVVLQRDISVPVWGWADAGEKVTVVFHGQTKTTTAGDDGKWVVRLDPLSAGGPHSLVVEGNNRVEVKNVLVGEVWVCSGQSNMQWSVNQSWNADLEIKTAKYPQIRLMTLNIPGQQKDVEDFPAEWQVCSPDTVSNFSAVGYYFGKQLHQTLDVPIGLIDNAWGGSSCEAWIHRDQFRGKPLYEPLLNQWKEIESKPENAKVYSDYEANWTLWTKQNITSKKSGKPVPQLPRGGRGVMFNQHRPANLYHARIKPLIPFAIRGAIWYQGESNAGRAYQYRDMFPMMIRNWRQDWGQGDFPFYWVQLADFRQEKAEPAESDWAELREAQTMAMTNLPNSGEAVIIDIGEASDIHPRNKSEVGKRLARWALAKDYGMTELAYRSPNFQSLQRQDGKLIVTFGHVGNGLRTVDERQVSGFAISGDDKHWHWADAKIIDKHRIEVSSSKVPDPVAVRYAWADNPVCNVFTREGLPLTPFRSDNWPGVTDSRLAR